MASQTMQQTCHWHSVPSAVYPKVFRVIFSLVCLLILKSSRHEDGGANPGGLTMVAHAFHLSFANRLVKSIHNQEQLHQHQYSSVNPLFNPQEHLIRPIECRNANNHSEAGICMFSIDCMQNKGVPLSICKHNYFVGTCCKLPDYNNFVGIVYDLRETESSATGQQQALEARRGSSGALHVFKSSAAAAPSGVDLPPVQTTTVTSASGVSAERRPSPETADVKANASETDDSTPAAASQLPAAAQQQGLVTGAPQDAGATSKYLISSTKLFGATSVGVAPTTTNKPSAPELPAAAVHPAAETARNADGSLQQQQQPPSQISFGSINDEQHASQQNSTLNSAYELLAAGLASSKVGPNSAPGQQQPSGNQLMASQKTIVVSSAHSAGGNADQQHQANKNSMYLVDDELTAELASSAHSQRLPIPTASIVFSNNHQAAAVALTSPASVNVSSSEANSNSATPSDQEFTLSTSAGASQQVASDSSQSAVTSEPDKAPAQSSIEPSQQTDASPFVDLVSSSLTPTESSTSSQHETTTPFTSSLSTAILPSISSHPYAPTTTTAAPPSSPSITTTTTPSTSQTASQSSTSVAQQSSQTLVFTTSNNLQDSSSTPTSQSGHETSAGFIQHASVGSSSTPTFVAQYYSTSTAPIDQNQANPQSHHHHHHHHRPLAGSPAANLQVASKIVTGNSAANNLIPGLSGLQSAILAHIPFKIASGLSSGLSSYLQAAIKPAAQSSGRPLISSNTAPALQYQQQQGQNHSGPGKPAGGGGSVAHMSAVRFPVASSTSASGAIGAATPTESSLSSSAAVVPVILQHQRDIVKEAQLVCGRPRVSELKANKRVARIVGGNQSAFGQWPWMVSLRQWRKGAFLHKCGAALLNENWAITAAHCVENVKTPDLLLRLGEFDVSNQNEPFPYIERRVKTVVSHPSFDPKTFEYDLALIRFTEPIQYERNIIPVCVPQGNDSYVDRMATVIGWGRLFEDGPLPDVIQHVDVPIITNQECEKMYKSAGFVEEIPDMFICAGISKGGRDSCEGDSGGPLTMVDHDGRSYLVGIISWGIGCALPSQPGVYTRITAFSSWINQIIAN